MKRLEEWAIASSRKITFDLFAEARLKIAFWYAFVGIVILAVGGYVVYAYLIYIIRDIIRIVQQLLLNPIVLNQGLGTTIVTQSIQGDLVKMSIAVGIWVIFTMIISAYILAEIVLWPIRQAVERQRRFIADVSHELRTPLSVMKTNSEVALMAGADASARDLAETLKSNLEEIDRMSQITQFLLNFSSFERNASKFDLAPTNFTDTILKAIGSVNTAAEEKGIVMRFTQPEHPVLVNGNAVAIGEMVLNLLKNAVAYTPQGGSVRVNLTNGGLSGRGRATLTIIDSGVGIPQKDLPRIFNAFYRGDNSGKEHKEGGSGLGLAIVKEIADLHRATISVRSEVGRGTAVTVRFPPFSR